MLDIRSTIFILGILLIGLAASMLIPAAVDAMHGDGEWHVFVISAAITLGAGGAMVLGFRQAKPPALTPREGFVLTSFAWILIAGFSSLPLMLSRVDLDFAAAYFEAMSGLTTSGGTTIVGLDDAPKGILMWRALLQWLGGVGIIVVAVTILPMLRVGGMQLFRMESSDKSEKTRPRVQQVSQDIILVYVVLTLLCCIALMIAGMDLFDAIAHAMTTIATGGFSTRDASIGHFKSPAIEWVMTAFMALAGCTFVLMAGVARGKIRGFFQDVQIRWYFAYLVTFVAALATWQIDVNGRDFMSALRSAAFNIVSVGTTSGFASEDYSQWGSLPVGAFMILLFIGGCSGSTSGGIKVFRYAVLGSIAIAQIRHLVHPNRLLLPTYNDNPISDEVMRSVLSFFFFYIGAFAVLTMAVTVFGIDLVTAMSGVAQALANIGPGLGPIIGPVGNYATLPDGALWLLSLAMMLGRLELLTVLVLLSPVFWRG